MPPFNKQTAYLLTLSLPKSVNPDNGGGGRGLPFITKDEACAILSSVASSSQTLCFAVDVAFYMVSDHEPTLPVYQRIETMCADIDAPALWGNADERRITNHRVTQANLVRTLSEYALHLLKKGSVRKMCQPCKGKGFTKSQVEQSDGATKNVLSSCSHCQGRGFVMQETQPSIKQLVDLLNRRYHFEDPQFTRYSVSTYVLPVVNQIIAYINQAVIELNWRVSDRMRLEYFESQEIE